MNLDYGVSGYGISAKLIYENFFSVYCKQIVIIYMWCILILKRILVQFNVCYWHFFN